MEHFEHQYRVRIGDCDHLGRLRRSALLGIMQDIATLHSDALGGTMDKLGEMKIVWYLHSSEVRMMGDAAFANAGFNELLTVRTWTRAFKGLMARRDYQIMLGEQQIAAASSDWFIVDTELRKPIRPPAQLLEMYPVAEEYSIKEPMGRIRLPKGEPVLCRLFTVLLRDMDENRHMNNAIYSDYVDECTEALGVTEFAAFKLEYKRELTPGSDFEVKVYNVENGVYVLAFVCEDEVRTLAYVKARD